MKVLAIGSDRTVAEGGSHAQERMRRYADALGELHIIVFSLHRHGLAPAHIGNLHIYPTNSFSRTLYLYDAARLARTLPRPDVVTAQDPFESGWAAARIARRIGVPLHLQLHTDPFAPAFKHRSLLNRVRILLMPAVLKRARVFTRHCYGLGVSSGRRILCWHSTHSPLRAKKVSMLV